MAFPLLLQACDYRTKGPDVAASAHKLPLLSNPRLTYFAPAGRDDRDEIRRKATLVRETEWIKRVLDAMPNMAMILNSNRQIVAANELLLRTLNVAISQIIEERPGEAVGCIRAKDGPDGCGTSHHCANCGAVNAILGSQDQGKTTVRESRILIDTADGLAQLDLKVTATPLQVGANRLTLLVLEDISQAKRLAVLERLFFHDVLNTAGCIQGYTHLLAEGVKDASLCGDVAQLVDQLVGEIQAHRDLIYAETGDLQIQPTPLQILPTLEELQHQYEKHPVAEGRTIKLDNVWNGLITTDRRFLLRVLGNMIKKRPGGNFSRQGRHPWLHRWRQRYDIYRSQHRGDARGRAASSLSAVVQHESTIGPGNRDVQHEAVRRALSGWQGGVYEPITGGNHVLVDSPEVGERQCGCRGGRAGQEQPRLHAALQCAQWNRIDGRPTMTVPPAEAAHGNCSRTARNDEPRR